MTYLSSNHSIHRPANQLFTYSISKLRRLSNIPCGNIESSLAHKYLKCILTKTIRMRGSLQRLSSALIWVCKGTLFVQTRFSSLANTKKKVSCFSGIIHMLGKALPVENI